MASRFPERVDPNGQAVRAQVAFCAQGASDHRLAVLYVDALAKKNSEALSFIPRPRLEGYAAAGQILIAQENGEPAGFLIFGAGWPVCRVYQACIQYDARRRHLGLGLVERLADVAAGRGARELALWCATDIEANSFWRDAGFIPIRTRRGGLRRARSHQLWARSISASSLFGDHPIPTRSRAALHAAINLQPGGGRESWPGAISEEAA
jgi:GNAT superfamily N-acetyltransferase